MKWFKANNIKSAKIAGELFRYVPHQKFGKLLKNKIYLEPITTTKQAH